MWKRWKVRWLWEHVQPESGQGLTGDGGGAGGKEGLEGKRCHRY